MTVSTLPISVAPFTTQTPIVPPVLAGVPIGFRLRIFNAANTAVDVTYSTIVGQGEPQITGTPSGDGQEVDILTGAVRTGAYVVEVIDAPTGPNDGIGIPRAVTHQLSDAQFRQQLLSRRAVLDVTFNGGVTYAIVWIDGFLSNVRQTDAIVYAFTVSDSRRVEQTATAFSWSDNPQVPANSERLLFPRRGCLLGGPIIDGFGPTLDSGGIATDFVEEQTHEGEKVFVVRFVDALLPGATTRTNDFGAFSTAANGIIAPYAEHSVSTAAFTGDVFQPLRLDSLLGLGQYRFPSLVVSLASEDGTERWTGTLRAFLPSVLVNQASFVPSLTPLRSPFIYATITASNVVGNPSASQRLRVRVVARDVSERAPLYFDEHPVDVVTKLYKSVNIPFSQTSANTMRAIIGDQTRLACRITSPQPMAQFLEQAIYGPLGFTARNNLVGEREFVVTRRIGNAPPTVTISTNDVRGDGTGGFALDEATVCSQLRYTYRVLAKAVNDSDGKTAPPPDGIVESTHVTLAASRDVSTFSTREVTYNIPGMIHEADTFVAQMDLVINGVAEDIFGRFERGAPIYEVPVLASSSAATLQIGDECLLDISYVPNKNYRIGESTVGARVAQVVRRDESLEGPTYKLVDSGPALQLTTVPTMAITKSTGSPQTTALYQITNAAALNALGASVKIEWGSGTLPSGSGVALTQFAPGLNPTTPVALPPVAPGKTVFVRASAVVPGVDRASAFSAFVSVALDGLTAPSTPSLTALSSGSIAATWTLTDQKYPVTLFVVKGGSTPTNFTPFAVAVLQPGSIEGTIRGLDASTLYRVGVAHVDPATGVSSAVASATVSTTGALSGTAPAMVWTVAIPTEADVQYPSGIALGLYAGNEGFPIRILRSLSSGGTYSTIAEVPGSTTVFVDALPLDNVPRFYKAQHVNSGFTDGPLTPFTTGTPSNVTPLVQRPPVPSASLEVNHTETASNYTISYTVGPFDIVTMSTDGGAFVAPPASPFVVTRNAANGAVKVRTLKSTGLLGDEQTSTVDVLPVPAIPASLNITTRIFDTEVIITYAGTGTVTVSINGLAFAAPSASPITVAREPFAGQDQTFVFRSVGETGDIQTQTIVIPKQTFVPASAPFFSGVSQTAATTPGDGGGSVTVAFTLNNPPVGVTFDVFVTTTAGAPITDATGSELGAAASPVTVSMALGSNAGGDITIEAYDGATLVATFSFSEPLFFL